MRRTFAAEMHKQMTLNTDIVLLTGDLGFKMWDQIRIDYPNRFVNCGASEQAMLDMAVGLALSGKIPFVYSITPFLLYRAFETLRTYIDHERINVKLVGSGRDKNYEHDGVSHWAHDVKPILNCLPNIVQMWPESKDQIPMMINEMIANDSPTFVSLTR